MEISGLALYGGLALSEADSRSLTPPSAAGQPKPAAPAEALPARVDLVQSQNLASPGPSPVDVRQAQALLGKVTEGLAGLDKPELRQLYQFHRLRELCCRLPEPPGR